MVEFTIILQAVDMKEMSEDAKKVLIDQIEKRSQSYGNIWGFCILFGSVFFLHMLTAPIFERMSGGTYEIVMGVGVFVSIGYFLACMKIGENIGFSHKQDLCSYELNHSMIISNNGDEFCEICYYPKSRGIFYNIFKF